AKTAILMSAACEAGAILSGVSPEKQKLLADFAMDLGIAFQLMDDILDYTAADPYTASLLGRRTEYHQCRNRTGRDVTRKFSRRFRACKAVRWHRLHGGSGPAVHRRLYTPPFRF